MNAATEAKLKEILEAAAAGCEIIPAFFQPRRGISNTVSAAIRVALKRGLLVECGKDGCGKPKYRAPIKTATHIACETVQ